MDSSILHGCVMNQKLIQFNRYGGSIVVLWYNSHEHKNWIRSCDVRLVITCFEKVNRKRGRK